MSKQCNESLEARAQRRNMGRSICLLRTSHCVITLVVIFSAL